MTNHFISHQFVIMPLRPTEAKPEPAGCGASFLCACPPGMGGCSRTDGGDDRQDAKGAQESQKGLGAAGDHPERQLQLGTGISRGGRPRGGHARGGARRSCASTLGCGIPEQIVWYGLLVSLPTHHERL